MIHNDQASDDAAADQSARLLRVVGQVAVSTHNQPLAQAVQTLKTQLVAAGITADSTWCRRVLEKVRRGETVVADLRP